MKRRAFLVEELPIAAELDDRGLNDLAVEYEKTIACINAHQQAVIAEMARRRVADAKPFLLPGKGGRSYDETPEMARERMKDWCGEELAPALRLAPVTARDRVDQAVALYDRFPAVWQALADGDITAYKARSFVRPLAELDPELAAEVIAKVLPDAADYTAGQLQGAIKREIYAVDPEGVQERHDRAKNRRHVAGTPADDAMGWLRAYLSADELTMVMGVLDAYAHACPREDLRTMDARRADALVELVTGQRDSDYPLPDLPAAVHDIFDRQPTHTADEAAPSSDKPAPARKPASRVNVDVRVVVGIGTLLGLDDKPGFLAGHGPIPADMARRLAKDNSVRRLLTDPETGILLGVGHERYRLGTFLEELVEMRDVTCRWPGCSMAARRCDKDHSIPFPQGCTCIENLVSLCRRHHLLKTFGDWKVLLLPGGTYQVTDPTGHVYITKPPPPGDVKPPTRNGKSIYLNDSDDPSFGLPTTKPEPYPTEPPF
jgi:hypothetical protein